MNNKESTLHRIVSAVVSCCATQIDDTHFSVTSADVLGKSRSENVIMTRCILVSQIIAAGYSVSTIAQLLNRTPRAIHHLIKLDLNYLRSSRAYRIASAQATLLCRDL